MSSTDRASHQSAFRLLDTGRQKCFVSGSRCTLHILSLIIIRGITVYSALPNSIKLFPSTWEPSRSEIRRIASPSKEASNGISHFGQCTTRATAASEQPPANDDDLFWCFATILSSHNARTSGKRYVQQHAVEEAPPRVVEEALSTLKSSAHSSTVCLTDRPTNAI